MSIRTALTRCPAYCGSVDPVPRFRDGTFADGQVSPDQKRIAAALPPLLSPTTRLLHVGVGCSDLAVRFSGTVARIDGITVLPREKEVAERLALPNYRVMVLDKHAPAFARLGGPYDLVVDNNPGSYACCMRHFRFTMTQYARQLAPGGRLVTDERGARWRQQGGIALGWRHWAREGRALGLVPERLAETVWGLRKG